LGFVGLIMYSTGRALTKAPLLARNHPFVKESLIHHTWFFDNWLWIRFENWT